MRLRLRFSPLHSRVAIFGLVLAAAAAKTSPKLATRLSKGEKRNRKRMAEVGTVYDATPTPRTPADILPATEEERREAAAGPVPANKWLMASVVEDAASVVGRIFDEAASSGSARFAATATSKTTGATTSPRNATASTSPAPPATSFRTRREAPPEEPHPTDLRHQLPAQLLELVGDPLNGPDRRIRSGPELVEDPPPGERRGR